MLALVACGGGDTQEPADNSGDGAAANTATVLNLDEDKMDEIYEYFKEEAQSDSVSDALKELGPDFEEEEVRLVRIKFISELGN